MRISIFGMGYVGVVSAACLLRDGHEVVGVDRVKAKVADLATGRSPVQEPGVAELLHQGHADGRLRATTNPPEALARTEMAWICVGTPSRGDGSLDLTAVEAVIRQIGTALRGASHRPLIVLRSTCLPGTCAERVIPLLEGTCDPSVGRDVHVVFHPEFLREGSGVRDFFDPPKIVVGEESPGAADSLLTIYKDYGAPVFRLALGEAEMVKYCDNLFHALKITFANEVGAIARAVGVDARRVAEVFCADTKLNISSRYLWPGPPFGGSCLPKDLRAILRMAALRSVRLPMLEKVLHSNETQIQRVVKKVLAREPRVVGMVGLAFKTGTDDMRESPYMAIAKGLIGEGIELRVYDPVVQPQRLIGSNKEHVLKALRHLEKLLVGSLDDLSASDLILVNHPIVETEIVRRWLSAGIVVLDAANIKGIDRGTPGYEGLYW
jgi:GDP-mannose 6-dehydrogenase